MSKELDPFSSRNDSINPLLGILKETTKIDDENGGCEREIHAIRRRNFCDTIASFGWIGNIDKEGGRKLMAVG